MVKNFYTGGIVVYTTVTCERVSKRICYMIASSSKGQEEFRLQVKIPLIKTRKRTWVLVHEVKSEFYKKGFILTGPQISSALCMEYSNIPHVYY